MPASGCAALRELCERWSYWMKLSICDRGDAATATDLTERFLRAIADEDLLERAVGLEVLPRARLALGDDAVSAADPYLRYVTNGGGERRIGTVPLYMDIHRDVEGLTAEAVAGAHQKDLEVQDKHGAKYTRYWFDEESGTVFCLAEAPSKEAAEAVHREAHGLMASEIIEVREGS
jgi:hypothetical protein